MIDIVLKVIFHNKLLFSIWGAFTVLGSLAGVFVDVFIDSESRFRWCLQVNDEVFYVIAISLIVAYIAEVISLMKIDTYDLGKQTNKKMYFQDEKIIILTVGIFMLFFMLIAYAEETVNGYFQFFYLVVTYLIGLVLFSIKHYDITEEKIAKEEIDDKLEQVDETTDDGIGKVV